MRDGKSVPRFATGILVMPLPVPLGISVGRSMMLVELLGPVGPFKIMTLARGAEEDHERQQRQKAFHRGVS